MPKKPKQTQRELFAERQRIDAAMEIVDAAKQKARAQREEYAKFLNWKVAMQRKERQEREAEQEELRRKVDERLRAVLEEHRERKREELLQWNKYQHAPVPAPSPSRARKILDEEEEQKRHEKEETERRAQYRKEMTRSNRERGVDVHTAPVRSLAAQAAKLQMSHASGRMSPMATTQKQKSQLAQQGYDPTTLTLEAIKADSKERGAMDVERAKNVFAKEVAKAVEAAGPVSTTLTPDQVQRLASVDQRSEKAHKRAELIDGMYEQAKNRRLYSTARMMADPPADYLIGSDLLRYIPAEVLDHAAPVSEHPAAPRGGGSPTQEQQNTGPAFFITEMEEQHRQVAVAKHHNKGTLSPHKPDAPRDVDDVDMDPQSSRHLPPVRAPGRGPRKSFDPLGWMHISSPPPVQVEVPREKDEEKATLQWYKTCYEPYTKIKKRTDKPCQPINWQSVNKHALPPKDDLRFTM